MSSSWARARSMSTALLGLKLLTSMHPHASTLPLDPLFPTIGPSSLPGTSTPPGRARSVLHPDNQRALALRGFYGDQLPEGIQAELDLHAARHGMQEGQAGGRKRSADDRRKQFHRIRTRRQTSLVESGDEDLEEDEESMNMGRSGRYSSRMKSVDFSTTTESTDSGGDMSTSAPTTPGDVFLDRCHSPLAGTTFPGDRIIIPDLDDFDHPQRGGGGPRLSDHLDVDSDVTPCASRQATMEKANTITQGDGEDWAGEGGKKGSGSRTDSSSSTDPGRKTVSIIVSEAARRHHLTSSISNVSPTSPCTEAAGRGAGGTGRAGMNFLSIVQAAVDRLSDSGSENTLVDQQSSSSGSPRPTTGSESPRLFSAVDFSNTGANNGGFRHQVQVFSSSSSGTVQSSGRTGGTSSVSSAKLETGPVLYVYHRKGLDSSRDENGNLSQAVLRQGHSLPRHCDSRQGLDEDLPRMNSIQSDSSGFVDTEVGNDNVAALEMASLKVSSLGSSCESSATMASTATVVASKSSSNSRNNNNHISSRLNNNQHPGGPDRHTPVHLPKDSHDSHKRLCKSADDILQTGTLGSGSGSASTTGVSRGQRYITMCYIPSLKKPQSAGQIQVSNIRNLVSACTREGRHSPRGPAHISVVLRDKGGATIRREINLRNNELPLSEELARASSRHHNHQQQLQEASSSSSGAVPAARQPASQLYHSSRSGRTQVSGSWAPASSSLSAGAGAARVVGGSGGGGGSDGGRVLRGQLSHPAVDSTSSVDGSRGGSCDELDRDDRSLSYSWWSRELPAASSLKSRWPRAAHPYPGTDEESAASVEGSSLYSCASTTDSIASGGATPLLDCHKLIKLINQPTVFKGRRTRMVHYRPRRQLRDWPGLKKRKRLQEETRLAQHALQKFKTELNLMESAVTGRYHLAYDHLRPEDRDDLEELQHLWAEVRQQATETEQLLMLRMKSLAAGNDNFNFLSALQVLQRLIDLLKEQHFQRQLDLEEDEEDNEEEEVEAEEEWVGEEGRGRRRYRSWDASSRYLPSSMGSWGDLHRPLTRARGRYSSSASHLPLSPAVSEPSYDQFRNSLVSEIREEMKSNLQNLQEDLQKRDEEIHRLQLQLMMEGRSKRPRSTKKLSRSMPLSSPRRPGQKETDV